MHKIGLVGGGNMGEALIEHLRKKYFVLVHEKDQARTEYLSKHYKLKTTDLKTVVDSSDVIIVAVKPQDIEEVLKELGRLMTDQLKLLVSIAAGITTPFIEKALAKKIKVIRTMPNLPVKVKDGMTAISPGQYAEDSDVEVVRQIFDHLGKTVVVKEEWMDAITAVSGSGPAYVFFFVEGMIKAACALGLKEDLSKDLVETVFRGSIRLLEKKKEDAALLRAKVTSKGGTTEAALEVFMKNHFDDIITQALLAAQKRAGELSRS